MTNERNRVELNADNLNDPFILGMILKVTNEAADALLIEMVAYEMRHKLAKKRKDGRGGWFTPDCESIDLVDSLRKHVENGDMIDVINLAAMILARHKLYGESA